MLLESALVALFSALGKCEGNQVSPLRRQEVPPLWLDAVIEEFRRGCVDQPDDLAGVATDGVDDCLVLRDDSELLREIVDLLDDTEGRGMPCLTLCDIERRLGGRYGRAKIESCMKKHGLNP